MSTLNDLKLLHLHIGELIEQAEGGAYEILEASRSQVNDRQAIAILVQRLKPVEPVGCDHSFRRIASGEFQCSRRGCGLITDELESEQWT